MVVGNATGKADATADQEVAHDGLEAGLSTFEVRASNERVVLASVLNDSGVESVLGGSVQIKNLFFDTSHAVENGRGKGLVGFNSHLQIVDGVDLWQEEHFSVCSPQNDNLISAGLHVANITLDSVDLLTVGTCQ